MTDRNAALFAELVAIMARLRAPVGGCPWDLEQTFETIAPYTIEEAYEVADSIRSGDRSALCDELGDLALQVVYHAQLAADEGSFAIADVLASINAKMVSRHPHVFGSADIASAEAQTRHWEALKAEERAARASGRPISALDGVALALPALLRAQKLQKRAARVGFDWASAAEVLPKIVEEAAEVLDANRSGDPDLIHEEVGDLLFAVVNLARKLGVDAEVALTDACDKFTRRFRHMEASAGDAFPTLPLDDKEALWMAAKEADLGAP